jgi:hypothetical protein
MKRRRVGAGTAALALALGFGLGACGESNTPEAYDTLTEQNFLETCTNFYFDNTDDTLTITTATVSDEAVEPPDEATCKCMYTVFTGPTGEGDGTDGGMPINETVAKAANWTGPNFTDLNADLKSNPEDAWDNLPQDPFKDGIDACQASGGASSGSTTTTAAGGDSSTSTTVGTDQSTTTTAG